MFGLAWGTIYPLIAIAGAILIYKTYRREIPRSLLYISFLNLLANVAFTPIQLGIGMQLYATLDILLILGTLAYFEWRIFKYSKLIFVLLLPYLVWGAFATVLQLSITYLNW